MPYLRGKVRGRENRFPRSSQLKYLPIFFYNLEWFLPSLFYYEEDRLLALVAWWLPKAAPGCFRQQVVSLKVPILYLVPISHLCPFTSGSCNFWEGTTIRCLHCVNWKVLVRSKETVISLLAFCLRPELIFPRKHRTLVFGGGPPIVNLLQMRLKSSGWFKNKKNKYEHNFPTFPRTIWLNNE